MRLRRRKSHNLFKHLPPATQLARDVPGRLTHPAPSAGRTYQKNCPTAPPASTDEVLESRKSANNSVRSPLRGQGDSPCTGLVSPFTFAAPQCSPSALGIHKQPRSREMICVAGNLAANPSRRFLQFGALGPGGHHAVIGARRQTDWIHRDADRARRCAAGWSCR